MHKKALAGAIAGSLIAPMVAQADVTVSGHVNRALVINDNGDTAFGDGTNSGTRFRIRASTEEMDGLTAGVNIEFGVDDGGVNQRHRNLWIKGPFFGEVKIGHTSDAADNVAYVDKSGVHVGHGKQGTGGLTYTIGGARVDGVHYVSPSVGLGSVLVSVANDDRVSGALQISNGGEENPTLSYKAAVGFLSIGGDGGTEDFAGAIGLKHASGFTATFGAGTVKPDGATTKNYAQGVFGYVFGSSAIAAALYDADPDISVVGIGVKHTLKTGVELYATAHRHDDGTNDATDFVLGAKVGF